MDLVSRQKLAVAVIVCLGIICGGVGLYYRLGNPSDDTQAVKITEPTDSSFVEGADFPNLSLKDSNDSEESLSANGLIEEAAADTSSNRIVVHVCGRVNNPGVYELKPGARVNDAIKAAGGTKPDADLESVNLAAKAVDGEQIYLPKQGTAPPPTVSASIAPARNTASSGAAPATAASTPKPSGPVIVNINTAGLDELDRLPGVGPVTAQKIIDYRRASGGFNRPEDIMNVPGIAEKKFADMKPYIVVK